MSNLVTSILRSKNLGVGLTAKSVILLMGDIASDEGQGIWASKGTMARELETTERTVQRQISALESAGFIEEVGKRRHRNGFTVEYRICLSVVSSCPNAGGKSVAGRHSTPDGMSPQPPTVCHPMAVTPDGVSPVPPTGCHPTDETPDRVSPVPPTGCHPTDETPDSVSPVPPTECHPMTVTPDSVSPQDTTVCHPSAGTPDTVSPVPPTECHPNQNKPSNKVNNISEGQKISDALTRFAGLDAVSSFVAYRRKIKKPLTVTAAKRLAEQLRQIEARGGDASDALGLAEERGWQSVKADWYFNEKGQGNDQRSRSSFQASNTDPTTDAIAIAARSRRPSGPDRVRG
ncbi:MAG: helix-turn-helix domain-containing protein [Shimia sp.]